MIRTIAVLATAATIAAAAAAPSDARRMVFMYDYFYYSGGELVGEARDQCNFGGSTSTMMVWGTATSDVQTDLFGICYEDGSWVWA